MMFTYTNFVIFLTILTALGSSVIGGIYFIFSLVIMRALERMPMEQGIAAMQSINLVILNPAFLGIFLGTAIGGALLIAATVFDWSTASVWLIAGALFYIVASLGLTMVFNVPLNNELVAVSPTDPSATEVWHRYLTDWTFWNHIRTAASLGSAASLMIGLVYLGQ
jgi:uncharacterized membrane protein